MDIRLTEEQREILSGRICPYCHNGILWQYIPILLLCGANGVGKDEPPGRNRYAGGSVRSNRERFLVMRYCKGRLKIGYFTHPAKMILETKIYFWKIDKWNTIAFAKPKK